MKETWASGREIQLVKLPPIYSMANSLKLIRAFGHSPEDMSGQKSKQCRDAGTAVGGLDDLGAIVPAVQDLAAAMVDYKVTPAMYVTVAEALLWTLGQGLGDAFTDEVKEALTAVYTVLSKVMIDAAEEVVAYYSQQPEAPTAIPLEPCPYAWHGSIAWLCCP